MLCLKGSDWRAPPPTPIFAFGTRLFAAFAGIRAALAPPPLSTFELFLGFMRSQVSHKKLPAPLAWSWLLRTPSLRSLWRPAVPSKADEVACIIQAPLLQLNNIFPLLVLRLSTKSNLLIPCLLTTASLGRHTKLVRHGQVTVSCTGHLHVRVLGHR